MGAVGGTCTSRASQAASTSVTTRLPRYNVLIFEPPGKTSTVYRKPASHAAESACAWSPPAGSHGIITAALPFPQTFLQVPTVFSW